MHWAVHNPPHRISHDNTNTYFCFAIASMVVLCIAMCASAVTYANTAGGYPLANETLDYTIQTESQATDTLASQAEYQYKCPKCPVAQLATQHQRQLSCDCHLGICI